jgi:hypothetical protein
VADEVVFQPGDTVAIVEHRRAPVMWPHDFYTVEASEGWVVTEVEDRWRRHDATLWLRKCAAGDFEHKSEYVAAQHARLVTKGPGSYVPGVSTPFDQRELDKQEFDALVVKIHKTLDERGTHEGWCNPATWATALAIKNDCATARAVYALRRKDGSRNLMRLRKTAWQHLRLREVTDPWMFEPPLDVPGKFAHWAMPDVARRLAVDWAEIELDLRDPSWRP